MFLREYVRFVQLFLLCSKPRKIKMYIIPQAVTGLLKINEKQEKIFTRVDVMLRI